MEFKGLMGLKVFGMCPDLEMTKLATLHEISVDPLPVAHLNPLLAATRMDSHVPFKT